ncbi:hypothetical protein [Pseudoxanthomonas sp. X-1]|uniref:hypothetical protein n=1 Tax=Pseudoxanthomonas sp. X-1 TaxID=2571115 RepID=UPI00110BE154|nr:hypothetical protein [Pseudoxanthomonas sp. X-1]TMN19670.1 hypothetical protein FF950_10690 [Pseudoxanthomonas sp. X-1]UAY74335.1 hypothetical protein LAJ50_18050 [Pseudoxanthomonas sp. X-1]
MALLISGYLFNLNFHPVRYYSNRAEGQKLFFMAAGSGLLLGAMVFGVLGLLRPYLASDNLVLKAAAALNGAIPIPHAGRLLATIITSIVSARLLNLASVWLVGGRGALAHSPDGIKARSRAQRVYDRLTERDGGAMAQLLRRAVDEQKLVMLTLKSRKIYCGRIFEIPFDLGEDRACIEILPSFSTWRDKDNLRMGVARTEYPVIDLWAAKQRLYSVEEQLRLVGVHLSDPKFEVLRSTERGRKFIRRVKRGFERERDELTSLIREASGGREININDWIKVILVKEIESLSFYDSGAYKDWFADKKEAEKAESVNGDI